MSARPYPDAVAEMKLTHEGAQETASVSSYSDGALGLCVESTRSIYDAPGEHKLTLGQAIQLRDFLNRHIDELALKQTGSLAVRSTDDPAQLASVEEIPHTAFGGEKLEPVKVYGCGRKFRPLHQNDTVRCGDLHGTMRDQRHLCIRCRAR